MAILLGHSGDEVEPPSRFQHDLPTDVDAVIVLCLCKSPDERFQSAAEFEQALSKCTCADEWTREDAKSWWQSMDRCEDATAAAQSP